MNAASEPAADSATPVVLELFTSEGCSSCPAADALLQTMLDAHPTLIGLGQHVDYWDQLGWHDRFSSAAATARQQVYGAHFNIPSVYTPQLVVDGRTELIGSDAAAAKRAIAQAAAAPHAAVHLDLEPAIDNRPLHVTVTVSDMPGGSGKSDIVLAVTEDHLQSEVKRGENRGKVLSHAAVVRRLTTIGEVTPGATATARADVPLSGDWRREEVRVVAFVQDRRGRAILGATTVRLRDAGR